MKKSIERIIGRFQKTIDELARLIEQNEAEIQISALEIEHHTDRKTELAAENDKAKKIIQNIGQMLGAV